MPDFPNGAGTDRFPSKSFRFPRRDREMSAETACPDTLPVFVFAFYLLGFAEFHSALRVNHRETAVNDLVNVLN